MVTIHADLTYIKYFLIKCMKAFLRHLYVEKETVQRLVSIPLSARDTQRRAKKGIKLTSHYPLPWKGRNKINTQHSQVGKDEVD